MTETVGITTVITEIGTAGILLSLGKALLQLALIIGYVVLIRKILKRQDAAKNKGAGLKIGWSVDEAEKRKTLGLDDPKDPEA